MSGFGVKVSTDVKDVIDVNWRAAETSGDIRIMELGSLDELIDVKEAEKIRGRLLKNKVQVKQLTNHRLDGWTKNSDFVERCMQVRLIDKKILPINVEVLIFDDTVALYRLEPEPSVVTIESPDFASQQAHLFDSFWNVASPMQLNPDGSTTYSVTIGRTPRDVFNFVSDLSNWPQFSDFARDFERVTDNKYIAHTGQGDILVEAEFDADRLLLDTTCVMPDGSRDFIPYRVVPNKDGAELMMTNFKPATSSVAEYNEQLKWMKDELGNIKKILEMA